MCASSGHIVLTVSNYSSINTAYTVPNDGYIMWRAKVNTYSEVRLVISGESNSVPLSFCERTSTMGTYGSTDTFFVRKGMKIYFTANTDTATFIPLDATYS